MLCALLLQTILLAQVNIDVTTSAPAPATQPTTQATVQVQVDAENGSDRGIEIFGDTRISKLFRGEEKLSPREALEWQFWLGLMQDLVVAAIAFIPRLFVAIVFLLVFWLIYRAVRRLVIASMGKAAVDPSIRDMLSYMVKWTIMGFGIVIACNQIGVQIAALLTGVSIIGLAVGFAAQETLANFIAGVVIFWDKPFKIGDWLEIEGRLAQVQRVTFRSTRMTDLDGDVVILPNTAMLAQRLINKTTNPVTRISVPIGITYKESIDQARTVLLGTLKDDPRIVPTPEPEVVVRQCGASSVDLALYFWIREERYEDAMMWEYLEKAKKALDAAGIEIPFPHVQLLVQRTPAMDALAGKANAVAKP